MKSIIARLMQVIETKPNYVTAARKYIGTDFRITRVIPSERGIFEKVNSEDYIATSTVKKIEITEENILVVTENTKYYFKVI